MENGVNTSGSMSTSTSTSALRQWRRRNQPNQMKQHDGSSQAPLSLNTPSPSTPDNISSSHPLTPLSTNIDPPPPQAAPVADNRYYSDSLESHDNINKYTYTNLTTPPTVAPNQGATAQPGPSGPSNLTPHLDEISLYNQFYNNVGNYDKLVTDNQSLSKYSGYGPLSASTQIGNYGKGYGVPPQYPPSEKALQQAYPRDVGYRNRLYREEPNSIHSRSALMFPSYNHENPSIGKAKFLELYFKFDF